MESTQSIPSVLRQGIVVYRTSSSGGRRATVHNRGRDESLGTAYSDRDLVALLEEAGVAKPEAIWDDPRWVEWRGARAHEFSST
jgi:hypothetical protein